MIMNHSFSFYARVMTAFTVVVLMCVTVVMSPIYASAQVGAGIAAIVGERGIITTSDVSARIALSELSAGRPVGKQMREKLFPQVLSVLIDEEILRQEAQTKGVTVNPVDLVNAVGTLEKQNNMTPGLLRRTFQTANIPYSTLERKIESQLLRSALLGRDVKPNISVSAAEVQEQMDNIVSKRGYYEVKLSEIVLPVSGTAGQAETLKAAEQLIVRIEEGVPFDKVASEFSRGPSAEDGGKLSWTGVEGLNPSVRAAVERMDIGQMTNPMMVKNAYHIIRLDDKRAMLLNDDDETEIGLRRIFLPLESEDPNHINAKAAILGNARAQYDGGCRDFDKLAQAVGSSIAPEMAMIQVKTLDKRLLPLLSNMPLGELSPVTKGESGMNLFMICERTKARPTPAARDKVKQLLTEKKLLAASERYMRNLRLNYYVDLK